MARTVLVPLLRNEVAPRLDLALEVLVARISDEDEEMSRDVIP